MVQQYLRQESARNILEKGVRRRTRCDAKCFSQRDGGRSFAGTRSKWRRPETPQVTPGLTSCGCCRRKLRTEASSECRCPRCSRPCNWYIFVCGADSCCNREHHYRLQTPSIKPAQCRGHVCEQRQKAWTRT